MSGQQQEESTQQQCNQDECNIKVETCAKVEQFFKDFHELFKAAQEIEVMNKTKLEAVLKRLCILRQQNEKLRNKNCTLREQYKRLLCEYNKLAAEVHDDSCSSESEDELKDCKDDKDICSVM
jgi:hypothetical protein